MPEYSREYSDGYEDGYDDCIQEVKRQQRRRSRTRYEKPTRSRRTRPGSVKKSKPRKLSGWQKFMKQKGRYPAPLLPREQSFQHY